MFELRVCYISLSYLLWFQFFTYLWIVQNLRETIHQEYREVVERRVFTGLNLSLGPRLWLACLQNDALCNIWWWLFLFLGLLGFQWRALEQMKRYFFFSAQNITSKFIFFVLLFPPPFNAALLNLLVSAQTFRSNPPAWAMPWWL